MNYTHRHYTFTSGEIDQIVALLKGFALANLARPVDARKLSKTVQQWAVGLGFLEWRNTAGACHRWETGARLYYCQGLRYGFPFVHIPAEALWRLVAPMIARARGFSITRDMEWETSLNINALTARVLADPRSSAQALGEMSEVLGRLANNGYIYFQTAGTIWAITVLNAGI